MTTDKQRTEFVKSQPWLDQAVLGLKPSTMDRRVEGEHILHAWRRQVDAAMAIAERNAQ